MEATSPLSQIIIEKGTVLIQEEKELKTE